MNGSIEIRYQKFLVLLYMLCLQIGENLSISFCYIESGCVISSRNLQFLKHPLTQQLVKLLSGGES